MSNEYNIGDNGEQPNGCRDLFIGYGIGLAVAFVISIFLSGCKCPECVTTSETERIVKVVERDTTIVTKADSASVHALLRCDSAYNVILDELVTMQGDRIEAELQMEKLKGGSVLIRMDCKEDSLEQEIKLRDSIISNFRHDMTVIKEKYVPAYYKRVSSGFWILLVLVLIWFGVKAYKFYLKIQSGGIL